MPYRVNDQLSVSLSIDDVDLSNHHENVLNVNIVEQAGTELPIVSMVVRTTNRRVPLLINEGNPLDIEISDDKQKTSPVSARFLLQRPSLTRSGADSWLVSSNGIKNTFPQWAKSRVETSASKSGVERILEVAQRAEGTVLDVPGSVRSSRDKQNWVQYGCPDKVHVDEIWMHCDLGDSFPLMASTLEGFVIVDARKLAQGDAKYRFGDTDAGGRTLYDLSTGVEHLAGFFASVGARGQRQPIHDLSTGQGSMVESEPVFYMSGGSPFADDFDKVANAKRTLTRNMHPNYWKSYAHNYTQIALYSSLRLSLIFSNSCLPLKPLDLVSVRDRDILEEDAATESFSGNYLVSKVARQVQGNVIRTSCQLVRECLNSNVVGTRT